MSLPAGVKSLNSAEQGMDGISQRRIMEASHTEGWNDYSPCSSAFAIDRV